jgi:hypothetical protein
VRLTGAVVALGWCFSAYMDGASSFPTCLSRVFSGCVAAMCRLQAYGGGMPPGAIVNLSAPVYAGNATVYTIDWILFADPELVVFLAPNPTDTIWFPDFPAAFKHHQVDRKLWAWHRA